MGESIVVGTDGSDRAKRAVQEAIRMAKGLGADLHVVTAFSAVRGKRIIGAAEGAIAVWDTLADTHVDAVLGEAVAKAKAGGVNATGHEVDADAVDALLGVADEVGADMIVVGSKGMHGARRFALGNVPNQISHQARCSVLIVNTDGRPAATA